MTKSGPSQNIERYCLLSRLRLPAFSRKSRACKKLSEKLRFSSLFCGFRIALQLLQEKIVYLSVSSKLDLRGLSFLVPSTMVFLNPKRTEIEFHSDYSLHLFYRQSGVYTTLDEKCRRWIVLSTAIVGTFLLAEVDTPLSR